MKVNYPTYNSYVTLMTFDPTAPAVIKSMVVAYINCIHAKTEFLNKKLPRPLWDKFYEAKEGLLSVLEIHDEPHTYGDSWLEYLNDLVDVIVDIEKKCGDEAIMKIAGPGTHDSLFTIRMDNPYAIGKSPTVRFVIRIMNEATNSMLIYPD